MGKYIDAWMQSELPRLQMILGRPTAGKPIHQPEGADTFPMNDQRPNIAIWDEQGRDARAAYGGPTFQQMPDNQDQPASPQPIPNTFGPAPQATPMTGPGQSMQQPMPQQADTTQPFQSRHKPTSLDDINTVDDLMPAIPDKTIARASQQFEQQFGGPRGVDQHVYNLTGRDPTALNKREKTELLIEFGLRLAAGGRDFGSNVAEAGLGAMGSARGMRAEKQKTYEKEADRAEKAREADLRNKLLELQIDKAKGDKFQLKTDSDGNLIRVDLNAGTSQKVLGADGQPVKGNSDSKEFASQIDRAAYESAFCEGLDGDAMKSCKQRALMYSKGGAPELAFPDLTRVKVAERTMTMMENPDNKRTKYTLPNGTVKAYADMTGDEKLQAANTLIDRWNDLAHNKLSERTTAKPAPGNKWGLSDEDAQTITEGKRAKLSNGAIVTRRNGKLVQVDEKGNPVAGP